MCKEKFILFSSSLDGILKSPMCNSHTLHTCRMTNYYDGASVCRWPKGTSQHATSLHQSYSYHKPNKSALANRCCFLATAVHRPNQLRFVLPISSHLTILLGSFSIMLLFAFITQHYMAQNMLKKSKGVLSRD